MNSKLFFYAVKYYYGGGGLGETGVRMKHTFFENFPIPETNEEPFIALSTQILDVKNQGYDTSTLEQQIDVMVYKLYDLTYDEVLVVEPGFNLSNVEYENYSINL